MSATSGIAILGAGIFAKEAHIPALAALGAGAPPLRAVYSRSEKSAKDTASTAVSTLGLSDSPAIYHDGGNQENSLDALLARSDISAVIVILPILTQPDIILKALAAGKHVLSEKPIAPDVDAGVQLIKQYEDAFKPKGLIWRVAENFELENGFVTAAKLVKQGKIGEVISFRATVVNHIQVDNKYYNTPWRTVPQYQGGFLLDGGVHFAAALRTVLGKPIDTISSFAALNREILPPHDTIHAIAAAGRAHGNITITFASPTKSKADTDDYVFIGTKGWIGIRIVPDKKLYRVTTKWRASGDKEEYKEDEDVAEVPQGKGVQHELGAFFDAVAGKEGALKVGEPLDALRDVAFIQAALNSEGKPVDLLKLVEGSDNARSTVVAHPSFSRKKAAEGTIASPFESPNNVNAAAVATLERLLERARQGAEIPQLQALLEQESPTTKSRDSSKFVDDEAEDAEGDDDEDENGNLEGFVVNDDVVEYDNDAPALPDDDDDEDEREEAGQLGEGGDDGERSDDDVPLSRSSSRLRRRRRADDDDESSDIEIVPTVATPTPSAKKGKGRAVQGPNRVDKNKDRDENPEARVDSISDRSDQPPTTSGKGKERAGQPTTRVEKGKGRADQAVARSNKGKGRANDTGSRKGDGPSTSSADRAHGEGAVKPQSTRTSSSPVANDFSWQTSSPTLSECARGLHPGSTALDGTHGVLEPLTVAPGDPVLTWQDFVTGFLDAYGFYSNARTMLGGCAFTLSDLQDNGWEYPSVETVAAAETHVNVRNLLRGLLFRRRGPYINDSQVELQDVVAVTVSQPTASAQRHKLAIKSTMAPAVSITGGVIRFWKIDSPTSGNLPIRYVIMSPYEGLFDHAVAFDCMAFGQENLYCMAFKNGIRYSTLPDWGNSRGGASAAPASPGKGKTSSSIRRGGNASSSRRTPKFELGANDNVTVLDARKVTLPDDISTWPTVLPTFEDPLPKNAVAFVAHTTSVWVGNRSASGVTHNIQFNLVYIVIIGALPDGFV